MARRPITPKHRAFVEAYVRLGVAWKAYAAAYPDASEATAQTNGPRLLRNAQVLEAVNERRANLANEMGLTPEFVLAGLRRVYEQAVEGAPKFVGKDGDIARDEHGNVVREWSPAGANRALELIGKAHGMWEDRVALGGEASVVFRLNMGSAAGTEPDYGDDPESEG